MLAYRPVNVRSWLLLILLVTIPVTVKASGEDELDNSKWKLQSNGWISSPTGYFNGQNNQGYFDLQRDFGFGNYVTFAGKVDWRFKRKHHVFFAATPIVSSRTTTIARTIDWQGQTFDVGAQVNTKIKSLIFTPGYQYDFFRFRQIWLGFLVNVNLAYTSASLKTAGSISGASGSASGSAAASGSVFAPLPAIGPTFRWYPISNSRRLYLEGAVSGMSFFGYGNFVAGNAVLGIPLGHRWDARAGYLLGSRLKINGSTDQMAIRLTQKGPVFGVEYHWGSR